jgi:Ca2+-transporting ATPase
MTDTPYLATRAATPIWHCLAAADLEHRLDVRIGTGLGPAQVAERLARDGSNVLPTRSERGLMLIFVGQLRDVMILVLIGAAVLAGVIGDAIDAVVILVIILLNALVGTVQEYRAERAMQALRDMAAPLARVRRDGDWRTVAAAELVPGDVVGISAGDVVPADLRLVEAYSLAIAESVLTGESVPVGKSTLALTVPDLAPAERVNCAFQGTTVSRGRGVGVVVATGARAEFGRIAALLATETEPRTPLQRRLAVLGARLSALVLAICALMLALGLARGEPPLLMLLTAVSLAVAAIPEALPAVVAIGLALGAQRLARGHALVRRLPAVEALGSVTVICTDKTGTLTADRMRVTRIWTADDAASDTLRDLARALALCNDAERGRDGGLRGDPTEIALYERAAETFGDLEALRAQWPRRAELPFDAGRRRMSTLHQGPSHLIAYTKGAPEAVLPLVAPGEGTDPEFDTQRALAAAHAMAAAGLRVLAVGYRHLESAPASDAEIERGLRLLGLIGLSDPPRPEAAAAVAECAGAGITPVMVTGDHPATAAAIAAEVGIVPNASCAVTTGAQLADLDEPEFAARVREVRVFARLEPEQKLAIVKALQARGEVVAVTGDGVNDAPALQRADIGVAMGRTGTDVARAASAMVLLDDNFATIVAAVREGRRSYDNIRKFLRYALTGNIGEIVTVALAPLAGLPIPLLPIHILWINLVTDGLPGLALVAETAEPDSMQRPPRPIEESVFARGLWQHMLVVGTAMGAMCLGAQVWALAHAPEQAQTIVFTALGFAQLGHVLSVRTERWHLHPGRLAANPALLGAVLLTVALQLMIVYLPIGNRAFATVPLTLPELSLCVGVAITVTAMAELDKWLNRRGYILYRAGR